MLQDKYSHKQAIVFHNVGLSRQVHESWTRWRCYYSWNKYNTHVFTMYVLNENNNTMLFVKCVYLLLTVGYQQIVSFALDSFQEHQMSCVSVHNVL